MFEGNIRHFITNFEINIILIKSIPYIKIKVWLNEYCKNVKDDKTFYINVCHANLQMSINFLLTVKTATCESCNQIFTLLCRQVT